MATAREIPRDTVPDLIRKRFPNGGERVLLVGPPGTGKTALAVEIARASTLFGSLNGTETRPWWQVTLTSETLESRIWGGLVPNETGGMREAQGPGQRAWHHGGLWIVNELHRGSADCHERIINALDDPSIATDTTALGTILRPRAEFGCIATQNAGSLVLSDALRDRFAMRIAVLRPSAGQLARLDHDVRVWVERAYAALPQSEWEIGPRPSYRDCLSFCQSRAAGIDDETAALAIMGEDTGDELRAWLESLQMIKGESARNRASGDTDTVVVVGVDDHTLTCPDCGQTGTGSDPGNCDIAQRTDFKRGGVAHLKCSACLAEWHEWADGGQDIQKRGTRPR